MCTVFFDILAKHENDVLGPEYIAAIGRGQTCDTDNPTDGFTSAAVAIWGGQVLIAGTETQIHGGYLTFTLEERDYGWAINGQGEINLVTALSKTAGPGGSGYPPVVAGPGDSGYPIVVNGANAGSVLVFNSANSDGHAIAGAIQIPLPVQSAASTYTVGADCANSAVSCWIEVPTTSGTIAANSSATMNANVNPQGLNPGIYSAMVAITITPSSAESAGGSSPTTINLPLTAMVAPGADMLGLAQTGIQFQTIAGAEAQSESISISNLAAAPLPFSTSASAPFGETWLSVSPRADTATSATPAIANIQANPAGLAPGNYFGRVDVSAPGAVNEPQSVDVALTVLPVSNSSAPVLSPAAVTVVANATGNPTPQTTQISNLSDQQLSLAAIAVTNDGAKWLTISPSNGAATAAHR